MILQPAGDLFPPVPAGDLFAALWPQATFPGFGLCFVVVFQVMKSLCRVVFAALHCHLPLG